MPLMYTFCTWFPLRFGCIIVALISVIQSIFAGIICILSLSMTDSISREINKLLHSNNMLYTTDLLKAIEKEPRTYIMNISTFFLLHALSCIALIHGAFKSSIIFILPYIIIELIRLIVIVYVVLTSMILIKTNVLDFLILILISVIGVFLLQILIYLWCCPVSLVQCLTLENKSTFQPQEAFEANNNNNALPKTSVNVNQDVVYDPLSDHYGWRPFKPSYSYPYENMPQYEY